MRKKWMVVLCVAIMVVLGINTSVVMAAQNGVTYSDPTDSAGNSIMLETMQDKVVDKDLYWAGNDFSKSDFEIGYDMLLAGQDIAISNGKINGAARMAGQNVSFTNVDVSRNATIAGQSLIFNDCKMDTGFFFCKDVKFDGKANCLHVTAQNASISGKIDGDVIVSAEKVVIEENTVIKGSLIASVAQDPVIKAGAKIGDMDVQIVEDNSNNDKKEESKGLFGGFDVWWFLASILMWLAMRFFMRKPVEDAGQMMMTKPGNMAAVGAIAMVSIPVAAVILLCTVIGIPIALILGMLYAMMIMVSVPFAGAAAGQAVFGKLVPNMNAWGSTIIGVAALLIICKIPVVGEIVKIAAVIFILGYFAKAFYNKYLKKEKNLLNEGGYVYATEDEIQ